EQGNHDAVIIDDGDYQTYVVFNPNQIRSVNAAFDPDYSDSPDIRFSRRFYSELARKVEGGPKSAMRDQWKGYINGLKQKGVKPDEIQWSGVMEWLDLQEGKVSREAVSDYLATNGVQVEEVELGRQPNDGLTADELARYQELHDRALDFDAEPLTPAERQEHDELMQKRRNAMDTSKYAQYRLPGGENYREVLLTLPEKSEREDWREARNNTSLKGFKYKPYDELTDAEKETFAGIYGNEESFKRRARHRAKDSYRSSHWDQPNVLAHVRLDDRVDVDGARVLFVNEIQSDWAQDGRKKGFNSDAPGYIVGDTIPGWGRVQAIRDNEGTREFDVGGLWVAESRLPAPQADRRAGAIPRAPFVQNTDAWVTLALKRIIVHAAEGGYDRVAIINGDQAADMFSLSNQISEITYHPGDEWLTATPHNSSRPVIDQSATLE